MAARSTPLAVKDTTALVVGVGGIGAPCAWALADAGIGRLLLVDFDAVEPSNLPRQILFSEEDVGRPKAEVASERLSRAGLSIEAIALQLDGGNGPALFARAHVAVDATDGASTKDLLNALAVTTRTPFVHAAALGSEGRVLDVPEGGRPCLACVFGSLSNGGEGDTCASYGVHPGVTGAVGYLAAQAALGLLANPSGPSKGLRVLDLAGGRGVTLQVESDPRCAVCSGLPVPVPVPAHVPGSGSFSASVPAHALDLTRESCPMNLLRARRALEALTPGSTLEIWLGTEGLDSVPEGLVALGHRLVSSEALPIGARLLVRRGAEAAR